MPGAKHATEGSLNIDREIHEKSANKATTRIGVKTKRQKLSLFLFF